MLMTLPPGSACLAASLFELMSGLKLPRHRRRTTRRVRADFMLVALEESPTTSSPLALCGLVSSTVDEPAEADDDIGRGDLAVADSPHGLATVVVATSSKSVPTVGLRHSRRA